MRKSSPIWLDPLLLRNAERTSKSKHRAKEESRAWGSTSCLAHERPYLLSSVQLKRKKEKHFKAWFMKQEKKGERLWQQVTNYSLKGKSVKPITLWCGTLRSRNHRCHCTLIGKNNWTKLIWRPSGLCPINEELGDPTWDTLDLPLFMSFGYQSIVSFSGRLSLNFPGTIKQKNGLSRSHI